MDEVNNKFPSTNPLRIIDPYNYIITFISSYYWFLMVFIWNIKKGGKYNDQHRNIKRANKNI